MSQPRVWSQFPRLTTQWYLWYGAVASILLVGTRWPNSASRAAILLVMIMIYAAVLTALLRAIVAIIRGVPPCPSCGEKRMVRKALVSFGPRFYQCEACGDRYKHWVSGGWVKADGEEDEPFYAPKLNDRPVQIEVFIPDGIPNGSPSIDALVRNQRGRKSSP